METDVRHDIWLSDDGWMQQAALFCLTNRWHRLADKVQYNLLTMTLPRMLPSLLADVFNHFKISASTMEEQGANYLVISEERPQKLYRFISPYYASPGGVFQARNPGGSTDPKADEEVLVWMGTEDSSDFNDFIEAHVQVCGKQWMTISDFLIDWIGDRETKKILGYFKETARTLTKNELDVVTLPAPTKRALGDFSFRAIKKIEDEDIPKVLHFLKDNGIEKEQLTVLKGNLLGRKRLLALFGENDYSQSFSASEWRMHYGATEVGLEQTGVVVGYIKAVEQLLWSVFSLSRPKPLYLSLRSEAPKSEKEKTPPYKPYPVTKELLSSREGDITLATLGHSVRLVEENSDLFEVSKDVQKKLADKILDFSKGTRCKLMHRANLSNEEVSKVRLDAITILCLILGAIHLTDNQEKELVRFNIARLTLNESLAEIREELNRLISRTSKIQHDAAMLYACLNLTGVWMITLFYQLKGKNIYQSNLIPYQPPSSMSPTDAQKSLASYLEWYLNHCEMGKRLYQDGCRVVVSIPNAPTEDCTIVRS